jgi:NADP-dependent 3-hydroxy acid dehydrogenase YdfG
MSLPAPEPSTTVVITGASSGVGTELARQLAERGYNLMLVARRRDFEREQEEVRVNVEAVHHLTGALLPRMLARGAGAILNVASVAGFQPIPYQATYSATKEFVLAFSERCTPTCSAPASRAPPCVPAPRRPSSWRSPRCRGSSPTRPGSCGSAPTRSPARASRAWSTAAAP